MEYRFFGQEHLEIMIDNPDYPKIKNLHDLYDFLSLVWSIDTCAPRLRNEWSNNNKTVGQCSITAFLVQDILGGEVYGILLKDNHYHCFNVLNNVKFDLTSEQFSYKLDYQNAYKQSREIHFSKEEKYQRYLKLKQSLLNLMK